MGVESSGNSSTFRKFSFKNNFNLNQSKQVGYIIDAETRRLLAYSKRFAIKVFKNQILSPVIYNADHLHHDVIHDRVRRAKKHFRKHSQPFPRNDTLTNSKLTVHDNSNSQKLKTKIEKVINFKSMVAQSPS